MAVAFAASATAALACSCFNWRTPQEQLEVMDLAVVARPVWTRREEGRGPGEGVTLFTVERTLKGEVRRQWRIAHVVDDGGSTCGILFKPGERVLLMANMQEGRLVTGMCHRATFPVAAYDRALAGRQ